MRYGEFDSNSLMSITNRPEIIFARGEGSWLFDDKGKAYLDFMQGWAVNCLGHCPPEIRDALSSQAAQLINPSPAFYNGPAIELASLLIQRPGHRTGQPAHHPFGLRPRLLRQHRRRGQRRCHQAGPQVGQGPQGWRIRDHHL